MKNRASGTAEGVAWMRYYESQRQESQRICNDDLAYGLSAWWVKLAAKICSALPYSFLDWAMEKKGMGVSGFLAVRTRFFDEYVLEQLSVGAKQYVVLGAGLDSRAYRFADALAGVKVFEIDHPLSQNAKIKKVIKHFGEQPSNVHYVPVDFTKDDLLSSLAKEGYDPSAKTVFTFEGVTMYLDDKAVKDTLNFILINSGPGSRVMFDYVYAEALDGRLKSKVIAHMNNLKFIFHESIGFGLGIGRAEDFIRQIGFDEAQDFPPQKLYELYLKPLTPNRPISDVYGIAVAGKR